MGNDSKKRNRADDRKSSSHHNNEKSHSENTNATHEVHGANGDADISHAEEHRKKSKRRRRSRRWVKLNSTAVLVLVSVIVLLIITVGVIVSHSKLMGDHYAGADTEETANGADEELEQQMNEMFSEYELYSLEIKEVDPEREFPLIRAYDENGLLMLSPIRLDDGSIEGTFSYEYDEDGNVITEKKYDRAGLLVYKDVIGGRADETARTLYETEFDIKGNYSGYTETLYNSDGVEISKVKCSSNGVVEGKYDFVFDENGRVIRENRYTPYGELSVYTEYEYDYLGNVTEKTQCDYTGKEVLRDVMVYDEFGRTVLEQHYTMGVCKNYTEYFYDEEGIATEKSYMLIDEYNMTYKEVK